MALIETAVDMSKLVGRAMESLTFRERVALTGKWIAMEIYTPKTLPLPRIQAVGDSPADCARQLKERGLDPRNYEFSRVNPPY